MKIVKRYSSIARNSISIQIVQHIFFRRCPESKLQTHHFDLRDGWSWSHCHYQSTTRLVFRNSKKNEQKTSIQWKCFLIILESNRSRMEKYMHRSLSQPQKQKKAFIGCKNWKNSSQSAAGGRKR